jgi:single-strand DNA-binding protein
MHGTWATGRLTRDPEMFTGKVLRAKFTVAVDDYDFGKKERITQFYNCVAFGKTAERIQAIARKGLNVTVQGKFRENKWEGDDGTKHSRWELTVDDISFNERKDATAPAPRPATKADDDEFDSLF